MNQIPYNQSYEEKNNIKNQLPEGHVIHTFISEHEIILKFLADLNNINEEIQKMQAYDETKSEFQKLIHIADHLVGAEPHHAREEEVLFPELESRGLYGPPHVMRMEHNELRPKKQELKELANSLKEINFTLFKEKLDNIANFIIATLSEHIHKENNILYPMALETIEDERIWEEMKAKCDEIGYCCFTPKR